MRSSRALLRLLVLTLLAAPGLWAQDLAELTVDHNVVSDLVTPHTAWATPYALGKTRVLFFTWGRGTEPREAIELGERFDLDFQMVFWARIVDSTKEGWHGGENGIRRMDRLLDQQWDAFVFLGIPPERLPTEQQYRLVKAVADGAGLVLRGLDDKRLLKDKNQLKALPDFLADVPGAAAFTVKQGRGVRLSAQPTIEYAPGWEWRYDEWAMRLGKAVLWAAGKAPQATLTLQAAAAEIPRASLPAPVATLRWTGATPGAEVTLTVRRDDGAVVSTVKQKLAATTGESACSLPATRAGSYYLDAVSRAGRAVEAFASVPLTVTSPRRLTELSLDRAWAEVGEQFSGRVTFTGNKPGPDERLVVSLLDRRGRELMRQSLAPVADANTFRFSVADWLPMLVTVRATLLSGPHELDSAWQFAHVTKRNRGQFNFLIWDLPGGTLAPYAEASLARHAMTLQLSGGPVPPNYVGAYDVAWVPYTTHISGQKDAQGVMKPACYDDEAGIQEYVNTTVAKYAPSREHGVFVYSLGDEISVRGSCLSPHCLAAYQRYLQQEYGDLAALNASWGTHFGSFAEVQLSKPDDNDEREAFAQGNFPRWYDRQAYQSYNFCQLCERFGRAFRALDPQSRCGFEGAGTFGAGDDLDGFVRSNGFWSPYPGTADEVVRSIAPRDFPRANWMGYTKDPDTLLEKYWRMVTRGTDAVWWWRWDCLGAFHGWLSPTLDPYPAVKEILRDTQVVRDGLGDLLLQSRMQDDGLGILFSQPSAYATKAQTSPSFGAYEGDHTAWHTALRDLGCNFRYFTDRQLRLGEVDLKPFKAIVLPLTQALGPQEAQRLRDYVQQGGTLIADARPGIYDGHCKPLAAGTLDEVFGVKRTGLADAALADATLSGELAGCKLAATASRVRVDTGLAAAGATPHGTAGGSPVLLSHTFGQGKTLLLNFPLSSYPSPAAELTPPGNVAVLQALLAYAGVAPAFALESAQGERLRNVEVTRWVTGNTQLVSIFRHSGLPEAAVVKLPHELYAYDLKARRDLGRVKQLSLTITPCRAQFFALAPQPLKPVAVQAPATASRGSVVRLALSAPVARGQQAVKVQAHLPNGELADWLARVVVLDRRGTTVELPVAYNDPVGKWTVTATELCTNQAGTCQFVVK